VNAAAGGGGGLDLPEKICRGIAGSVALEGAQVRVLMTRKKRASSGEPPLTHVILAAPEEEVEAVRGRARVLRRLELHGTGYGPIVRLALAVYPEGGGEPLSGGVILNTSRLRGEVGLGGLAHQETLYLHFYAAKDGTLHYAFSKALPNGEEQRGEAREILRRTRDAYAKTPEGRRSFALAARLAERRFEPPVAGPPGA
jgi:hypothetical protein